MITQYTPLFYLLASFRTHRSWMQFWLRVLTCISLVHFSRYHEMYTGKFIIDSLHQWICQFIAARTFTEALFTPVTYYTFPMFVMFYISAFYVIYFYFRFGHYNHVHSFFTVHICSVIALLCVYRIVYESHSNT